MRRMRVARLPAPLLFGLLGLLGVLGVLGGPAPWAASGSIGGSLALTSDYVYHGIAESCGDPAAQVDVHFRTAAGRSASETYLGVWGSADISGTNCHTANELNAYLGHSWMTSRDSSATLTYVHFAYLGEYGHIYDYDEIEGSWAFEDRVVATLAWTPDTFRYYDHDLQKNRSAFSYGLQVHEPLAAAFTLSAGVGYDEFADPSGTGYGFWNAGVGYTLGSVQLDLTYFDTASRAVRLFGTTYAGSRVAATALWRF